MHGRHGRLGARRIGRGEGHGLRPDLAGRLRLRVTVAHRRLTNGTRRMAMRILVIDDYVDAVEVWELYLRAAGFEVLTATDGVSGLQLARTERPDVVVMDLQMPGLSGVEVAQALRADE